MGRLRLVGLLVSVLLPAGPALAQYEGIDVSSDTEAQSTDDVPRASGEAPAFTRGSTQRYGDEGVFELSGSAALAVGSFQHAFSFTFGLQPYIGYFIAKNFELGFRPGFMITATEGGAETAIHIALNPHYHFDLNSYVLPYVGAELGFVRGAFGQSINFPAAIPLSGELGISLGAEGGLKIPVGNAGLLKFAGQYATGLMFGGAFDQHIFQMVAGAGLYF